MGDCGQRVNGFRSRVVLSNDQSIACLQKVGSHNEEMGTQPAVHDLSSCPES